MEMTDYIEIHKTAKSANNLPESRTTWISLSPATIEFDQEFRIRNWSEGAGDILRFDAKEIIGQGLEVLFMKKELEYIRAMWRDLLESGKSVPFCCSCIDKFGHFVMREGCLSVPEGSDGTICVLTLGGPDASGLGNDVLDTMLEELNNRLMIY